MKAILKLSILFLTICFFCPEFSVQKVQAQNPKQMKKHRKAAKRKQKPRKEPIQYKPKRKDSDGDGVADYSDHCEDTPRGQAVTSFGCPMDRDFDGIVDSLDACVEVPGPKDNKGCPWPDTDGDGLLDNYDKCINTAGPRENMGCPWADRDNDGIIDKEDKCPDTPGVAKYQGCPDTDNDGIMDYNDRCPETPGVLENFGCPPLKKEEQEALLEAFNNLHFESGRAIIKPSSYTSLNKLSSVMKSNPKTKLILHGHTDNVGAFEDNMILSEDRAKAVKRYLAGKGIRLDRMSHKGFGETKPVDTNETVEGRKNNRRVEMTLVY